MCKGQIIMVHPLSIHSFIHSFWDIMLCSMTRVQFQNILPPSSGLKSEPNKQPAGRSSLCLPTQSCSLLAWHPSILKMKAWHPSEMSCFLQATQCHIQEDGTRISDTTHCSHNKKINTLQLLRERIIVYSWNYTEHLRTKCQK